MDYAEAQRIVVQAGKEGQKELLKVLCSEMNSDDMDDVLEENGYVTAD